MEPWTFACVADIQSGSPRSFRYNPGYMKNWRQAKKQLLELNPELLLVAGDISRDGSFHDFELDEMSAELGDFPFPVHIVPGNMDTGNKHTLTEGQHREPSQCTDLDLNVTSEQLQAFKEHVGPLWWSVDHKNVRFSGLTDLVLNSNLPEEDAFWQWAEAQAQRPQAQHHVWVMHYAMFADDLHEPNWDITHPTDYLNWYFCIDNPGRKRLFDIFRSTGTDIVISGHIHCHHVAYAEGICFEIAPATCFGQWGDRWEDSDDTLGFLKYTVNENGITAEMVPLEETWDEPGYGPGGHPAVEARDYSLAWQKD